MKVLLDTHLLLWAAGRSRRMPKSLVNLLMSDDTVPVFSAASLWEIAIKRGLGREDFDVDPRLLRKGLRDNGYTELAVTGDHALAIDLLPPVHKDPFDRILIAQAIVEGILLLTADPILARYPGPVRLL